MAIDPHTMALIRAVANDGIKLALSDAGKLRATGNRAAIDRWLPRLREAKPEIIEALRAQPASKGKETLMELADACLTRLRGPQIREAANDR
jgi:hypothetical protein